MARNLRTTFDEIMKKYGHDILLQRRVNEYTAERPEFSSQLEMHTVRHMYPSNKGLPTIAGEQIEGIVHDSEMIYYMRYNVNPAQGDRIYENMDLYPNNLMLYVVDFTLPMRYIGGRVEYWVVGASQETPG